MDNQTDLTYLQSHTGKQAIINTHVEGITQWSKKQTLCSH
ncbi:MAG: hypothetical protein IKY36_03740 [Bacteroidales bacterium]|nr:hypothetical protein [Bacteroidales bacterium]